jgi:hypothetical protein
MTDDQLRAKRDQVLVKLGELTAGRVGLSPRLFRLVSSLQEQI